MYIGAYIYPYSLLWTLFALESQENVRKIGQFKAAAVTGKANTFNTHN